MNLSRCDGRRMLVGAALPLLLWLLAPSLASASCGDYVHVGQRHSAREHHQGSPTAPCHGPHCSRHDAPLTPPPSAPALTSADDGLPVGFEVAVIPVPTVGHIDHHDLGHSRISREGIFHPPRR